MPILFKERDIVVPGEIIAQGKYNAGEGTFRDNDNVVANVVGLVYITGRDIRITSLQGTYKPREGDIVIGQVTDTSLRTWKVDINAPWTAVLPISNVVSRRYDSNQSDPQSIFRVGEYLLSRVSAFDRVQGPTLTVQERGLGKLTRGRVVNLLPSKIPRLVGRKQSMIDMIEKETGAQVEIGQNGVIWINARTIDDEILVERVTWMIERESHTKGLTDRVREFIRAEKQKRGNENDK
jgi:exosome complex component RRP4